MVRKYQFALWFKCVRSELGVRSRGRLMLSYCTITLVSCTACITLSDTESFIRSLNIVPSLLLAS
jgi:hypothetical protein